MSLPPTQPNDIPGPARPRYRKQSPKPSPAESGPSDTVDLASTSREYLDPQKDMLQHLKDAKSHVDKAWDILLDLELASFGPSPFGLEHSNQDKLMRLAKDLHKKVFDFRVKVKNLPCEEISKSENEV